MFFRNLKIRFFKISCQLCTMFSVTTLISSKYQRQAKIGTTYRSSFRRAPSKNLSIRPSTYRKTRWSTFLKKIKLRCFLVKQQKEDYEIKNTYRVNFFTIYAKYNRIYRVETQFTYLQQFYMQSFSYIHIWFIRSNLSVAPGPFTLQVVPRKLNVALARRSRSQIIFRLCVVKNFENFTGKRLCKSTFLTKMQSSALQLY